MKEGAPRVELGQQVWPGDIIGQVGNTGTFSRGNHLHYSTITEGTPSQKDPSGGSLGVKVDKAHTVDPATFDTGIRYLDQTLPAERTMFGSNVANDASMFRSHTGSVAPQAPSAPFDGVRSPSSNASFADRFGNWNSPPPNGTASSPAREPLPQRLLGLIMDHIRQQNEQAATNPPASVFDTGAPPVPFVPDDSEDSFADRFGDRPPVRRLVRLDQR